MSREEHVAVLLEVARRAALKDPGVSHPVDISNAISFAVEYAGETLAVIQDRDRRRRSLQLGEQV